MFLTLFILLVLVVCVALVVVVWSVLLALAEDAERVRLEREAMTASWRIHKQAVQAFGRMLEAAREDGRRSLRDHQNHSDDRDHQSDGDLRGQQ